MDNNELSSEITRLSAIWYEYVGLDHHKDRDCHWIVETRFSYGEGPNFQAAHYGYILHDWNAPVRNTLNAALCDVRDKLLSELQDRLARAEDYIVNPPEDDWGFTDPVAEASVLIRVRDA